jgi:zinc protease
MLKELSLVCGEKPLSVAEHQESVSGILLGYPGRFERVGDLGAQLAELAAYDRPLDWYQTYPGKVGAVTLIDANGVASRHCDTKDFSIVVAGDRKALEASLGSLERPIIGYDHRGSRLK